MTQQFEAYLFKRSSLGHVIFSAAPGSKLGNQAMATGEFKLFEFEYTGNKCVHIVPIDQDAYAHVKVLGN